MKNPTAILTADWHLMDRAPQCRTDAFRKAMWRKVDFIRDLAIENQCPIWIAGDVFDRWKVSTKFVLETYDHLIGAAVYALYGQHDLPNHCMDRVDESALCCLAHTRSGVIGECEGLVCLDWGEDDAAVGPESLDEDFALMTHQMAYQGKKPYPGCPSTGNAKKVLRKYPWAKMVLTGDNHQPFVERLKGRILVNPGSLMRTTAAQIDHKPRVYLWSRETNEVEPVFIPIEKGVVSREHIDRRDTTTIEAYVRRLEGEVDVNLSFRENMRKYLAENNIGTRIKNIIQDAQGDEYGSR